MHPVSENYHGEVAALRLMTAAARDSSSVSQPFCDAAARALSSEGKFFTRLFATQGTDLRAPCAAR